MIRTFPFPFPFPRQDQTYRSDLIFLNGIVIARRPPLGAYQVYIVVIVTISSAQLSAMMEALTLSP